MKTINIITSLIVTVLLSACSTNEIYQDKVAISQEQISLSFQKQGIIIAPETGETFTDFAVYGDTVAIVSEITENDTKKRSVQLYSLSAKNKLTSISQWENANNETESFTNELKDIYINQNYIVICQLNSRADLFDRNTMAHVKTIGTGNWHGNDNHIMVHSFGSVIWKNYLIIRDITQLRIYDLNTLSVYKDKQVPFYAKSVAFNRNNSYTENPIFVDGSNLYIGDYGSRNLHQFELSGLTAGKELPIKETLSLKASPTAIFSLDSSLWVTQTNGTLHQFDFSDKTTKSTYALNVKKAQIGGEVLITLSDEGISRWAIHRGVLLTY